MERSDMYTGKLPESKTKQNLKLKSQKFIFSFEAVTGC